MGNMRIIISVPLLVFFRKTHERGRDDLQKKVEEDRAYEDFGLLVETVETAEDGDECREFHFQFLPMSATTPPTGNSADDYDRALDYHADDWNYHTDYSFSCLG